MIKKILSLSLTNLFCFLVFSQNISFEASEGYVLGEINNQQGWNYVGSAVLGTGNVSNNISTIGANSLNLVSNNTMNDGGVKKNIVGFNVTEYSFDYKIENIDGSDYFMVMRDNNNSILGAFAIEYENGNLSIYDGILDDVDPTNINILPNVWYQFKMIINKTNNTVQYYINNTLLGNKSILNSTTNPEIIDFSYDDFGTGFTVDNIQILNFEVLSTLDYDLDLNINIYPNPTSNYINIKSPNKLNSIEVYDSSGKLILSDFSGRKILDISSLQNGLYFLKIKTKNQIISRSIIKK